MKMQKLQALIDMLTKGRKIHISILDINGVLNTEDTEIAFENVIHSKEFCNIAKSTERGYRLCLNCKNLANTRAIKQKQSFCGTCFYGVFEVAVPLVIDGVVMAVIYVGNAVVDKAETFQRIDTAARYSGVDAERLRRSALDCEELDDAGELFCIGEIVRDYLKMLYGGASVIKDRRHWLVLAMKRHADEEYCAAPTLKELAVIYHKNEKYMGRLFEREMGISFNKYCLGLRLEKAREMLLKKADKIIDVALECGFENISYFNRAFKSRYGVSPTEYRKKPRSLEG